MGPEPTVELPHTQVKEYFRMWKKKNINKARREAKGCRKAGAFIDEKQTTKGGSRPTEGRLRL